MTVISETLHATTVAVGGQAVLILGASGAGKSSLALELIALGAVLVADDRTILQRDGDLIRASVPLSIEGMIEARGIGILKVQVAGPTPVNLIIDLDQLEDARLPPKRQHAILGFPIPCLHKVANSCFASAILIYLKTEQESRT